MALSLNYPSPYGGADFTYFIIGEVRENRYNCNAEITMYGFLNQSAREDRSAFVSVVVAINAAHWAKDATIAQIYGLVKTMPEFAGATDA